MNITTRQVLQTLRAINWTARLGSAMRATIIAAELLLMVAALAIETIYEHRQQIRAALVRIIAAVIVAAELTYHAGRWTRNAVHVISERSVVVLPQQPVAAVAPITATLQALREALAALVARLYPVPVQA